MLVVSTGATFAQPGASGPETEAEAEAGVAEAGGLGRACLDLDLAMPS